MDSWKDQMEVFNGSMEEERNIDKLEWMIVENAKFMQKDVYQRGGLV